MSKPDTGRQAQLVAIKELVDKAVKAAVTFDKGLQDDVLRGLMSPRVGADLPKVDIADVIAEWKRRPHDAVWLWGVGKEEGRRVDGWDAHPKISEAVDEAQRRYWDARNMIHDLSHPGALWTIDNKRTPDELYNDISAAFLSVIGEPPTEMGSNAVTDFLTCDPHMAHVIRSRMRTLGGSNLIERLKDHPALSPVMNQIETLANAQQPTGPVL